MNNDVDYKENKIVKYALYIELFIIASVIALLFICRINNTSILEIIFNLIISAK